MGGGFTLREYQKQTLDKVRAALRRTQRVLLQSPTGSGKSVMIASMIGGARERGLSAWLICHRRELLDQLSGTLWASGVPHGFIAAGRSPSDHPVQLCSVQTLVRRLGKLRPPNLLAVDEAHHASAASYRKILAFANRSWVVGLTATPVRTDGAGLDDLFDDLVEGPSVAWLMERGFLSRYRVLAPPQAIDLTGVRKRAGDFARGELEAVVDQSAVVGDAVSHYQKYLGSRPGTPVCLVYCVSRVHARHVTEAYRQAGVNALYCAGDTPDGERKRIIEGFRHADPAVIVSVDLFGEGLDVPRLDAVQLLRPTQSLGLHLQQIGRALRPDGDKVALIMDHVGNTYRHGLPDDEREWSLEGSKKKDGSEESGPAVRGCDKCFSVYSSFLPRCPQCGHEPEVQARKGVPDEVEGELEEVDPEEHRRRRKVEEYEAGDDLESWVKLAMERRHKASWAGIRWSLRTGVDRGTGIKKAQRLWRELA